MGETLVGVVDARAPVPGTTLVSPCDIQTLPSCPPTWDLSTPAAAPDRDPQVDGQGRSLDSGHAPEALEQAPPLPGGQAAGTSLDPPSRQV